MTVQMKIGFNKFVTHLNKYFQEYIELIPATILVVFGIVTALPIGLMGSGQSVYAANIIKLIFGILILTPGVWLIYLRVKYGIIKYIQELRSRRNKTLFYITVTYIYMTALSAGVHPYPPRWALFLALGCISFLCYIRLSKSR